MSAFTSLYSSTNYGVMDETQLRLAAPSLFAVEKHDSRSERYTYIPTIDVLRGLQANGFQPVFAAQGRCRVPGKSDFTKHMVRLRSASDMGKSAAEANEVVLLNSHDGTSSYQLMKGIFRFVCRNGMVVADLDHDIRIPHKGNIQDEVIDGCIKVIDDFKEANELIERLKALPTTEGERMLLADTAAEIRFGTKEVNGNVVVNTTIMPQQLLRPRRSEDYRDDAWTVFNRLQENAMQGGLRGRLVNGRRASTRAITGVDSTVGVNRALWRMAEQFAELKGA